MREVIYTGWEVTCPMCHCEMGIPETDQGDRLCDNCSTDLTWKKLIEDESNGLGSRYETRTR